ncbi:DNL-type zinc finger protein [Ceratobasidium theobromae]|uniref:DNL-type zinc finger protein n=1 Tax=Ceratobasidium theobromae TaxID=1582974 RepID=A0A5N5QE19_9AGAM|nr:DNL-type zinc finger protein [Ceratobasidium theobromae]
MFRQFISSQTRLLVPIRASTHNFYPRFPLQASFSLQQRLVPRPTAPFPSFSTCAPTNESGGLPPPSGEKLTFENPEEPRLSLTFTCTVEGCGHRSSHTFTKRAYTRGIVIVQCPGCKNRHLIADHLDWFKETAGTSKEGRQNRTIEDIMREKGERVQRGQIKEGGVLEYWDN